MTPNEPNAHTVIYVTVKRCIFCVMLCCVVQIICFLIEPLLSTECAAFLDAPTRRHNFVLREHSKTCGINENVSGKETANKCEKNCTSLWRSLKAHIDTTSAECFMCKMCLWVASNSRDDERTQRFNDSLHSLMRLQIGFVKFKLDLVNALLFSKFSHRNFSMITHLGSEIKSAADHWFFSVKFRKSEEPRSPLARLGATRFECEHVIALSNMK